MKSRFRKLVFAGTAWALCLGAAASAEIHTFWKTDTCPNFMGQKPAIAWEVGVMEAAVGPVGYPDGTCSVDSGIGGVYCNLLNTPLQSQSGGEIKVWKVLNALVTVNAGDGSGLFPAGDAWNCVVCQYDDHVVGQSIPTLSTMGLLVLTTGILTTWFWQRRKETQAKTA